MMCLPRALLNRECRDFGTPSRRRSPHSRAGISVLDVLAVLAALAILIGLVLPATGGAREAARRVQCRNNLNNIGTALQNYYDTFRWFPSGWIAKNSRPNTGPSYGWQTSILPYMDLLDVYGSIEFSQPPLGTSTARSSDESGAYSIATQRPISQFRCPSDPTGNFNPFRSAYGTSNFSGNFGSQSLPRLLPDRMAQWWPGAADTPLTSDGFFYLNSRIRSSSITDGTSNTLLVGERCINSGAGIWMGVFQNQFENDHVTDCSHRSRINATYGSFSSVHAGGANFLLADGSTQFIQEGIDSQESSDGQEGGVFQKLASRAGDQSSSYNMKTDN